MKNDILENIIECIILSKFSKNNKIKCIKQKIKSKFILKSRKIDYRLNTLLNITQLEEKYKNFKFE